MTSPRGNKDGSWDRTFFVADVSDAQQAKGVAAAAASTTYLGCSRDDEPDIQPFGYSLWEVTYHYSKPSSPAGEEANQPDQPTGSDTEAANAVIEFETTGGTAHITQCLSQTDYGAVSGADVKNAKVLGASGDSVEGTDIVVPKMAFTVTRKPPQVSGAYAVKLYELTGKTNTIPYILRGKILGVYSEITFGAGDVMFLGVSLSGKDVADDGRFIYHFEAQPTRLNFDIGGINIPKKLGFEYLWVQFTKQELTNPPVAIPVPQTAYVAKLQEDADFLAELGF